MKASTEYVWGTFKMEEGDKLCPSGVSISRTVVLDLCKFCFLELRPYIRLFANDAKLMPWEKSTAEWQTSKGLGYPIKQVRKMAGKNQSSKCKVSNRPLFNSYLGGTV